MRKWYGDSALIMIIVIGVPLIILGILIVHFAGG